MKAIFRGLSVSMIALVAAGCTTPNPTPLDRPGDVPPAFTAPVADKQAPIWPEANWWVNFKADELPAPDGHRPEGKSRPRRRRRARAARPKPRTASPSPTSCPPSIFRARPSAPAAIATTTTLTAGPGGTLVQSAGSQVETTANSFSTGLAASYSADFWGLYRDRLYQARENLRAARYAETVVGLTVESSVAQQYFTVLATRERIVIARQNIDAAKRILTVVQAKVTNGVSSNLDLAQEQSVVATQEARLPGLMEQEREARYALAILLGKAPEGFDIKAQNLGGIVSPSRAGRHAVRALAAQSRPWRKRKPISLPPMPMWMRRAPPSSRRSA